MRQLDELLIQAADRGERAGPERLIEHLERRLDGEHEQVVAKEKRRGAMVTTTERPPPSEIPKRPWTRWAVALAGFAIVVAAVAVAVVAIGESDDDVAQADPFDVAQTFAQNMRAGDIEAIADMWTGEMGDLRRFLEWNIALGTKPEFTDCRVIGETPGRTSVSCTVIEDENSFYSRLLGPQETTVTAFVSDAGTFKGNTWPPPAGLLQAESQLRDWIVLTHPELEDKMFGTDYGGIVKMSTEAGELRMQYLDDYLAYRDANS